MQQTVFYKQFLFPFLFPYFLIFFSLLLPGKIFPNVSVNTNFIPVSKFHLRYVLPSALPPTQSNARCPGARGSSQCGVPGVAGAPCGGLSGEAWQPGPIPPFPILIPGARYLGAPGQPQPQGSSLVTNQGWHQPVNLQLNMACGPTSLMQGPSTYLTPQSTTSQVPKLCSSPPWQLTDQLVRPTLSHLFPALELPASYLISSWLYFCGPQRC